MSNIEKGNMRSVVNFVVLACSMLLFLIPSAGSAEGLVRQAVQDGEVPVLELVGQTGGSIDAVVVQGDYAYFGVGPRLIVADIRDHAQPVVIGQSAVLPGIVLDVAVHEQFVYVAAGDGGLRVLDVSQQAAPREVGFAITSGSANSLVVASTHIYVATSGGLQVMEIDDPVTPREVGKAGAGGGRGIALAGHYAYVATFSSGLRIIDIRDPAAPQEVGAVETLEAALDVAVAENYAYVASIYGLWLVDVTNPATPLDLGAIGSFGRVNEIVVDSGRAYLAAGATGLQVLDLADPAAPHKVRFVGRPRFAYGVAVAAGFAYVASADGLRVVDLLDPTQASEVGAAYVAVRVNGVTAESGYAYLANSDGLRVMEMSDPAVPREVGFVEMLDGAHAVVLTGAYAYVAGGYGGLRVVDVSNPTAPREVGFVTLPGSVVGLAVAEGHAYLTSYEGLWIVDIASPAEPVRVASVDELGQVNGVVVAGAYAYVTTNDGLRVVDVSNPTAPREVGFMRTLGNAFGITLVGHNAFIATTVRSGGGPLVVADVSNPAAPHQTGAVELDGARDVALAGSYAYVTQWVPQLRILAVSNQGVLREVGVVEIHEAAWDVAVSEQNVFLATGDGGLLIYCVGSGEVCAPSTTSAAPPLVGTSAVTPAVTEKWEPSPSVVSQEEQVLAPAEQTASAPDVRPISAESAVSPFPWKTVLVAVMGIMLAALIVGLVFQRREPAGPVTKRVCPDCGYASSDSAAFCGRCGARLPMPPPARGQDGSRRTVIVALLVLAIAVIALRMVLDRGASKPEPETMRAQSESGAASFELTPADMASPTGPAETPATNDIQANNVLAVDDRATPTASTMPMPTALPVITTSPTITLTPSPSPAPTATVVPVPPATAGPVFSQILFCAEECQANGGNAQTLFPGGTTRIYVRWAYEEVPVGVHYERRWYNNERLWAHYDCTWPGPVAGVDLVTLSDPDGLISGIWEIEILIDEQLVARQQVTLTGDRLIWEPPGYFDSCYGKK